MTSQIQTDSPRWAVEVMNLSVRFGDFYAVKNISFHVRKGEIFGFLGANGAGKTTTIRVLCGLLLPTEGHVQLGGITFADGAEAVKSKVGYMSQKFTLYDDLTVEENLEFTASLRKLDDEVFKRRRDELFSFISFDRPVTTLVKDLPGGIKQQVSLAAALLHSPEIVFLDEPTAGVTPAARARFWALIRKLSEQGTTIFVTTHYMDEAEQCERIALMRAGEIIALDSPGGLKSTAFPLPLYELDPLTPLKGERFDEVKNNPLFSSFEPYGLRYHVTVTNENDWKQAQPEMEKTFKIRTIPPSLEDVFIRMVEGKTR